MKYETTQKVSSNLENLLNEILKAFLKTKFGGWFFSKIIDAAVDQLSSVLISPLIDILIIRIHKKSDIDRARKMIDNLEKAKNDLDKDAYNNSVDDLLGGV